MNPTQAKQSIQPSLFLSHGSPDLILGDSPAKHFYQQLATQLTKPDAIIVVSAHWETPAPIIGITASAEPKTIHDFYGFPDALYRMTYPAPGAPKLAERVQQQLQKWEFDARLHETRGLDHGAWSPLKLIYPEADIPVIQISLPRGVASSTYWQIGQALQTFSSENILIIGSGAATHNLSYFNRRRQSVQSVLPEAKGFMDWLNQAVISGDKDALLAYDKVPYGLENHPTPEHFVPLLVAAGAGSGKQSQNQEQGQDQGEIIHDSFEYGFLSMACYRWE